MYKVEQLTLLENTLRQALCDFELMLAGLKSDFDSKQSTRTPEDNVKYFGNRYFILGKKEAVSNILVALEEFKTGKNLEVN
jgi:hypothetical protein